MSVQDERPGTELRDARLRLADLHFRNGTASALDILDAQRATFAAQLAVAWVQVLESQNLVQLYKALGGGWKDSAAPQ